MNRGILVLLFFGILFAFSCKSKDSYREGILTYNITYLEDKQKNPIIELLPNQVQIKFKEDNTVIIVEGFWGTFQIKFISNQSLKKNYTLLRILDKTYYVENSIDSINAGFENLNDIKISTDKTDTAMIAGVISYSANVISKTLCDSVLKFYYTYDINIKNPNAGSPFKDIDGVLTKFTTEVMGIKMQFKLSKIEEKPVDISEFKVPEGYKKISRKKFEEILKSFQE